MMQIAKAIFVGVLVFSLPVAGNGCSSLYGSENPADAAAPPPLLKELQLERAHAMSVHAMGVADAHSDPMAEAVLSIDMPALLPAGKTLSASAAIENARPGAQCGLIWYVDGVPVLKAEVTTGEPLPELVYDFEYSYDMPLSAAITAQVKYISLQGSEESISAQGAVVLENYDRQYWAEQITQDVLDKVTTGYKGDNTLKWALDNDLDDFEKEVWVNANGFTSRTEYLIWISTAYQRTNIFQWSEADEQWELIRSCIVGTGIARNETPQGVTHVSGKQEKWTFIGYNVRPVVNFYPGSNYAFHSRLYYPDSPELYDPSIGYPVSQGCIRMYDADINFIYDNIPVYTAVVVH